MSIVPETQQRMTSFIFFFVFFYFSSMPLQTYLSYHTVSYKLNAKSKFKSENKNALGFEAIIIKIC